MEKKNTEELEDLRKLIIKVLMNDNLRMHLIHTDKTEVIIKLSIDDSNKDLCDKHTPELNLDGNDLKEQISQLMRNMGFKMSIKGYKYIQSAILMALEDNNILEHITKGLYPEIAKKYKTTSSRVERAIRHSIELVWKDGNMLMIEKVYGYTVNPNKGKPTNTECIAGIVEYLKIKNSLG